MRISRKRMISRRIAKLRRKVEISTQRIRRDLLDKSSRGIQVSLISRSRTLENAGSFGKESAVVGSPGFEPGSREPKSRSLDHASRRPLAISRSEPEFKVSTSNDLLPFTSVMAEDGQHESWHSMILIIFFLSANPP